MDAGLDVRDQIGTDASTEWIGDPFTEDVKREGHMAHLSASLGVAGCIYKRRSLENADVRFSQLVGPTPPLSFFSPTGVSTHLR